MEPVTTVTTAWSIAKTAGEISKKLYELGKGLKDREAKQHVDEIADKLRELKRSAAELEDENRELRKQLRFRNGDYEFITPFWFERGGSPPLCARCFATGITAPMGERGQDCNPDYRKCLVCGNLVQVSKTSYRAGVVIRTFYPFTRD